MSMKIMKNQMKKNEKMKKKNVRASETKNWALKTCAQFFVSSVIFQKKSKKHTQKNISKKLI